MSAQKVRRASFRSLESANRAVAQEREFTSELRRMYDRRLIDERARLLDARDAIEHALSLIPAGREAFALKVLSAALAKIEER